MGNKPFDAIEHFALNDVYLWATDLHRENDYAGDQRPGKTLQLQSMRSFEMGSYEATIDDGSVGNLFRVLVTLGLRSLAKDPEDGSEEVLYSLEATFAVEYWYEALPETHDLQKFVEFNCVHNCWPFWRQHVYDTLKRASLPVPVVPLFGGQASVKSKNRKNATLSRRGVPEAAPEPSKDS